MEFEMLRFWWLLALPLLNPLLDFQVKADWLGGLLCGKLLGQAEPTLQNPGIELLSFEFVPIGQKSARPYVRSAGMILALPTRIPHACVSYQGEHL